MAQLKRVLDNNGNEVFPITHEKAVRDTNGTTLESKLAALNPFGEVIVGELPSSGVQGNIYRVPGTNSYSDYGWDGSQFVLLATYTFDADDYKVVTENGFYVIDDDDNIAMQYNGNGFDAAALSTHFLSLLPTAEPEFSGMIQTNEGGFYVVDEMFNIGMALLEDGLHVKNIIADNVLGFEMNT